jgi:ATP-dependent DNA helicase RecG
MQVRNDILNKEVRFLKGVGEKRARDFRRLGIRTIEDLFNFFPRRYEDRTKIVPISNIKPQTIVTIRGEVIHTSLTRTRRGMPIYEAIIEDNSGAIIATWFHQPYLKDLIKNGKEIILYGRASYYKGLRIISPEYEILEKGSFSMNRILPVYSLTGKLSQNFLRKIMRNSLDKFSHHSSEVLPYEIRKRLDLVNRIIALKNIHFPQNWELLFKAQYRLSFEELFLLQLAIGIKRIKKRYLTKGISHKIEGNLKERFLKILPFELTKDQKKVMKEIEEDMISPRPMNRLLQGEVGTGKTIIAGYSAVVSTQGGYQTAIMVPTEILAQQQFLRLGALLSKIGIEVEILISATEKNEKNEIKKRLKNGEVDVIIGTHALIQEDIEFKNLGLVVIDEQHKFGVLQRRALKKKGKNPDLLIMTATPIPRTLSLTFFGDMDISTMKEFPKGEKNVSTYWVTYEKRENVYKFLNEMIEKGEQAFVVCPRIEKDEEKEIMNAEKVYEELRNKFKEINIALLHSKIPSKLKEKTIGDFAEKKIDILVSTIIVEVGIDIPDASCMIIEEADRFGLSQLHQLRGRIGRSGQEAYCILIADPKTEEAGKRLEAISKIEDGFEIAEEDLNIRGPGELFGIMQHGFIDLRFKNMIKDIDMLELARKEAFKILRKDPFLQNHPNCKLKEHVTRKFIFV